MDKQTFRDMSYGLFVLGAAAPDGRLCGCTVNTAVQVGSDPAVVALSMNRTNYTNEVLHATGRLAISILSQEAPLSLIGAFGFQSGRTADKFDGIAHRLVDGLPVLTQGVCGYLTGTVTHQIELASHTLFVLEITQAERTGGGAVPPMTYAYYHEVKKGKKPATAPTYVADEPASASEADYVCNLCGYVYDGSQGPFAQLPDTWACPVCGAPKSAFEHREK